MTPTPWFIDPDTTDIYSRGGENRGYWFVAKVATYDDGLAIVKAINSGAAVTELIANYRQMVAAGSKS